MPLGSTLIKTLPSSPMSSLASASATAAPSLVRWAPALPLSLSRLAALRSLSSSSSSAAPPTSSRPPHMTLSAWATVDPDDLSATFKVRNFVRGEWRSSSSTLRFPDPLHGRDGFIEVPDTKPGELGPFLDQLRACPRSGLHNPLKNPQRYVQLGNAMHRAAEALDDPAIQHFFTRLVQRVIPKSTAQCRGEVTVTSAFLKTFAGDATRFFVGRGFTVPGDHPGQYSSGYRFPYGPVAVIAPFNFPLEIPALQLVGAVLAGNCAVIKPSEKVAPVCEQFIRLLLACGVPADAVMMLNGGGATTTELVAGEGSPVRMTQFTGSSTVSEALSIKTHGRVRVEDAGFNWKILGPGVLTGAGAAVDKIVDYVAFVCDQDAYAASGQKCSAQSCLFVHPEWASKGLIGKLEKLAKRRKLEDLTIGPVLSWTTEAMMAHVAALQSKVPNAKLLFGGRPLEDKGADKIPKRYGALQPTAVRLSIRDMLSSDEAFKLCTTEVFGPVQILVDYDDRDLDLVLKACERMTHHLTCAVVSKDPNFLHRVLGETVNGTTYAGVRARTTGAPTNHWFGPAGDPRCAGIGTPEAIAHVWTCHREVVRDELDPGGDWTLPAAS